MIRRTADLVEAIENDQAAVSPMDAFQASDANADRRSFLSLEAITRKCTGEITKSAATPGPKAPKAWHFRPSSNAIGAIEIPVYCVIVYTDAQLLSP
jgi:hypothetical protein